MTNVIDIEIPPQFSDVTIAISSDNRLIINLFDASHESNLVVATSAVQISFLHEHVVVFHFASSEWSRTNMTSQTDFESRAYGQQDNAED